MNKPRVGIKEDHPYAEYDKNNNKYVLKIYH